MVEQTSFKFHRGISDDVKPNELPASSRRTETEGIVPVDDHLGLERMSLRLNLVQPNWPQLTKPAIANISWLMTEVELTIGTCKSKLTSPFLRWMLHDEKCKFFRKHAFAS